jgi:hypothetical protein
MDLARSNASCAGSYSALAGLLTMNDLFFGHPRLAPSAHKPRRCNSTSLKHFESVVVPLESFDGFARLSQS